MRRKYRLYRNLHKGCFSVQEYIPRVGYRVVDHISDEYVLTDCTFKVYESGRHKVLQEKRKNVHAYVLFNTYSKGTELLSTEQPYYNPYKCTAFISSVSKKELKHINKIQISNNQLYI